MIYPRLHFCYFLCIVAFLGCSLISTAQADETEKRPNILFIIADDQAPSTIGAYGNEICSTPHIDELAKEGMTFDGAYHMGSWVGAVCTASRHMIMSGRTVWHIPQKQRNLKRNTGMTIESAVKQMVPPDLADFTMAAVFNQAGYDTMRTCKKGNSYPDANAKFSVVHDSSKRGGEEKSGSHWHGDRVLDYLQSRAESNDKDPFLVFLGFSHPHDPRNGTAELLEKYGASNKGPSEKPNSRAPPLQINYLPQHPFHHGHPNLRDEVRVQGVNDNRDAATIRNELGREYACIENNDNQVGRVIARLKEMGEFENTYIIYTSDHGISVGRHGLMGKQNLYQHTWRVPYIVRGPGIKAGSRKEGNIYLLDTLATMCELAGIAAPKTNEGKSFKSVLMNEKDTIRETLYGVYCGGTKPGIRSIKRGSWKLIKYDVLDGEVQETQLFNLDKNPNELLKEHHAVEVVAITGNEPKPNQINLAHDPQHAVIRKELETLLLAEQRRLDDPYRMWDQK